MNPTMKKILLAPQGIVKRGLVAWYDFADVVGSQVLTDKSGNGNHGQNGSTVGTDTNDVTFNGLYAICAGDDYVILPDLGSVYGFQLAFYNNDAISAASTSQYLLRFGVDGYLSTGSSTGYLLNEIITVTYINTIRSGWCNASDSVTVGWHLVECVWDGAKYRIILDGAEKPITTYGSQALLSGYIWLGKYGTSNGLNGNMAYFIPYVGSIPSNTQLKTNRAYIKKELSKRGIALP